MTESGIACGRSSKYANTWYEKDTFEEISNDKMTLHHLCKKCLAKFKVSSHNTSQQGADSGQLQQHDVSNSAEKFDIENAANVVSVANMMFGKKE